MPLTFTTNSGTATSLTNSINLLGGTGVTTSGSGDTVTITSTATPPPTPSSVLLHTITFNNTANTYDLTSYLTGSGYSTFKFLFSQVPGNNDFSVFNFEVSTNGGSTWITSGYFTAQQDLFRSQATNNQTGSAGFLALSLYSCPTDRLCFAEQNLDGWGNALGMSQIGETFNGSTSGVNPNMSISYGNYPNATINGLRIRNIYTSANLSAGTLSIYGVKK